VTRQVRSALFAGNAGFHPCTHDKEALQSLFPFRCLLAQAFFCAFSPFQINDVYQAFASADLAANPSLNSLSAFGSASSPHGSDASPVAVSPLSVKLSQKEVALLPCSPRILPMGRQVSSGLPRETLTYSTSCRN